MTAVDFPNSPTLGQTFSVNNRTWIWTGTTWDASVSPVGVASGGVTGQVLTKSSNVDYATTWSNTVSSVIAGTGLTGGTITTTGTLAVDSNVVPLLTTSQTFTGAQTLVASNASIVPLTIKGYSSQTGNLLEAKTSSDSIVAKIDSTGSLFANTVSTLNSYVTLSEQNSGGLVTFTRQTTAITNPGANAAGVYFSTGETAGSLRLSLKAGSSGEEVTLLENIPQTGGTTSAKLGSIVIEGGNA